MRWIAFLAVALGVAIPFLRLEGHFMSPFDLVFAGSIMCLGWAMISWISYSGQRRTYWFSFWLILAAGGFFFLLALATVVYLLAWVAGLVDRGATAIWLLGAIALNIGLFRFILWRIDVLNRNRARRSGPERAAVEDGS